MESYHKHFFRHFSTLKKEGRCEDAIRAMYIKVKGIYRLDDAALRGLTTKRPKKKIKSSSTSKASNKDSTNKKTSGFDQRGPDIISFCFCPPSKIQTSTIFFQQKHGSQK